jgi:hypothetical protein
MNIKVEMLAPWSVAVYVDGKIDDCFDCANDAVEYIRELTDDPANVSVTFDEGFQWQCEKAAKRGWKA